MSPSNKASSRSAAKQKMPVNYAVPALDKAIDVLELLAHRSSGLTKSQLARELNRTMSEIFRVLVCLERRGYIAQLDEERYSLTLKLFKLVQEHPPTERLLVDALPIMARVAHETLQSCHIGVLEGSSVVILGQTNPPTDVGFYVKLGSSVDIMSAASGYVILAHQNPPDRERILETWMRETGGKPPRDLGKHLDRIRMAGYEKRASYLVKGVVNISFPVFDSRGSVLCALTVPYIQLNESTVRASRVIDVLRSAASEIMAAIGGAPLRD
jgi:DNA-binding IclR family transcriptional regulator